MSRFVTKLKTDQADRQTYKLLDNLVLADEEQRTIVVPRRATGLGISGHFILGVAVFGEQCLTGFLNVPQGVVFRQGGWLVPEHRIGL